MLAVITSSPALAPASCSLFVGSAAATPNGRPRRNAPRAQSAGESLADPYMHLRRRFCSKGGRRLDLLAGLGRYGPSCRMTACNDGA
jgi:hypothetical protein